MRNRISSLLIFSFILISTHSFAQKDSTHFVTTWKTNYPGYSGDSSITIFTYSFLSYNYDVDWNNDGIFDDFNITDSITHNYGDTGIFTIRIRGTFPRILIGSTATLDNNKLIGIEQWGTSAWVSMRSAFYNCNNLEFYNATDSPNLTVATSMRDMFNSAHKFNGDINSWDVSNITNMARVFKACPLFNQNLNSWNVSNVIDFRAMFSGCVSFNADISGWNTTSAVIMDDMFRDAEIFNQDISNWNVSNVEDFNDMFMYCDSFNVDIGNWDVSSATDMNQMFRYAISFNQNINNWDVDSVIDMGEMFWGASTFNQDLKDWDVRNVTDMSWMFHSAANFNQDISNWNVSKVTNMWWMFRDAISFNQDISNWNVSSVTDMYGMFSDATSFDQNLGDWNIQSVTTMRFMFANSGMSVNSYDSTLIAWQAKQHLNNVLFYPTQMKYCNADSARALLIADGWTFANSDSKDCSLITGIEKFQDNKIALKIYPNPSKGLIEIELDNKGINQQVNIYTMNGKLVNSFETRNDKHRIDLTYLNNGVYFVRTNKEAIRVIINK